MKTAEQVLTAVKSGQFQSQAIDGRDFGRLAEFFPLSELEAFGYEPADADASYMPKPFTEEEIKKQLAEDLEFAFEKALNKRGISSSCMFAVIKMWMWVLDDDYQVFDAYENYGLPLYKAVALKYGLPNEIGEDTGAEDKYSDRED